MATEKKYITVRWNEEEENHLSFIPYTWKNRKKIAREEGAAFDLAKVAEFTASGKRLKELNEKIEGLQDQKSGDLVTLNDELETLLKI